MKKMILCVTMVTIAATLFGCGVQEDQTGTQGASSYYSSEVDDDSNSDKESSESNSEIDSGTNGETTGQEGNTSQDAKKEFIFTSAEEVENISDEDLVYILENDYITYDFFEEGSYSEVDLFGVKMQVPTEENPEASGEYIMSLVFNNDDLGDITDFNTLVSSDFVKEYAQRDMEDFINSQNTKRPQDETGILIKDEEIIFCGETDTYVEYSARYVESRTFYENDVLVTHDIPRAYRRIYMKSLLWETDNNGTQLLMLGDLNQEYVKDQLDLYLSMGSNLMLYREVAEEEDCYTYTRYYTYMVYGDYGIDNEAQLYKETITVDKENHEVYYEDVQQIKVVRIVGSAPEYPMEF